MGAVDSLGIGFSIPALKCSARIVWMEKNRKKQLPGWGGHARWDRRATRRPSPLRGSFAQRLEIRQRYQRRMRAAKPCHYGEDKLWHDPAKQLFSIDSSAPFDAPRA